MKSATSWRGPADFWGEPPNVSDPDGILADIAAATAAGHYLDKGQQVSNWARRPLDRKQLLNAAVDAEILLDLRSALAGYGEDLFTSAASPDESMAERS